MLELAVAADRTNMIPPVIFYSLDTSRTFIREALPLLDRPGSAGEAVAEGLDIAADLIVGGRVADVG